MIHIREYAHLTCNESQTPSLDHGVVSRATLDWLFDLRSAWHGDDKPLQIEGRHSLKLGSYVGYLESPAGESIEILPKTCQALPDEQEQNASRALLQRMLSSAMGLKPREAGSAHLRRYDQPLHEWIMAQFLAELADLVRRGLRSDYQNVEEESRFIRGRLDMTRQLRQRPDRATWFHIQHDIFSPEIIENRVLATALAYVRRIVKSPDNWRLANELSLVMADIPVVQNPEPLLKKWRSGKLMRSYDAVRPWCQLIIERLNPQFQYGGHKGIALLFPMEMLFESYVASCLRRDIGPAIRPQVASQYLLRHAPVNETTSKPWFQLKPDILLTDHTSAHVLDTKWKLLQENANGTDKKYNISQSDLYQLFAYGHKYMSGTGHMALIYPKHPEFLQPLPCFSYSDELHLWAIPFDLEAGKLVSGEWETYMPALARDNQLAMTG